MNFRQNLLTLRITTVVNPKNIRTMLVILDNGHGSLVAGEPTTPKRRSIVFPDKTQLFEGEFNRAIVNGLLARLTQLRIPYVHVSPELHDVSMQTRVNRANRYYDDFRDQQPNSFLLSIHSNASPPSKRGQAHGSEFWIYKGSKKGRVIADTFAAEYELEFPDELLRTPNPRQKYWESGGLKLLRATKMPAIISENFFFDNIRDARSFLIPESGRRRIIDYHLEAILRVQKELFEEPIFKG